MFKEVFFKLFQIVEKPTYILQYTTMKFTLYVRTSQPDVTLMYLEVNQLINFTNPDMCTTFYSASASNNHSSLNA